MSQVPLPVLRHIFDVLPVGVVGVPEPCGARARLRDSRRLMKDALIVSALSLVPRNHAARGMGVMARTGISRAMIRMNPLTRASLCEI